MKPNQLRAYLRNYPVLGILIVSAYFGIQYLRIRRHVLIVGTVILIILMANADHSKTKTILPAVHLLKIHKHQVKKLLLNYHPERLLLNIAHPVLTLPENILTHFWLSNNKLLLITQTSKYKIDDWENYTNWRGSADVYDVTTKTRMHLRGLTRILNLGEGIPGNFQWSPEHEWLQWNNCNTGDCWPNPTISHLDGTDYQEFGIDKFSRTFWLDSYKWAEAEVREFDSLQLIVHDARLKKTYSMPLRSERAQQLIHNRYNAKTPFYMPNREYVLPKLFIISDDFVQYDSSGNAVVLTDFDDIRANEKFEEHFINLQGNRIVTSVRYKTPHESKHTGYDVLWLSDPSGKHICELGCIPYDEDDNDGSNSDFSCEWKPDGKSICFVFDEILYELPVK